MTTIVAIVKLTMLVLLPVFYRKGGLNIFFFNLNTLYYFKKQFLNTFTIIIIAITKFLIILVKNTIDYTLFAMYYGQKGVEKYNIQFKIQHVQLQFVTRYYKILENTS
jgi:hypothetical protein